MPKVKPFQSYIERLMYILLFLIVAINVAIGVAVYVGLQETKHQGIINQKYIRCIILVPRAVYQDPAPDARAKAVDDCAIQSRLP